jgi:hypothetical protein
MWLVFQWSFGERLRRKKEMPALDGTLSAQIMQFEGRKLTVSCTALWRNRSPFPIRIDVTTSRIDVFRIPQDFRSGGIVFERDFGDPIYRHEFLKHLPKYELEPLTESPVVAHFLLEPGLYGIQMRLYAEHSVFGCETRWIRELILDARKT